MDRLLSEQAVINAIHAYWLNEIKADGETDRSIKANTRHSKNICGAIKALPSAEPQERTGHWIDIDSETYTWKIRCSKCGHERSMMSTQGRYPNFCEECGFRMGVDNE